MAVLKLITSGGVDISWKQCQQVLHLLLVKKLSNQQAKETEVLKVTEHPNMGKAGLFQQTPVSLLNEVKS